MTLPVNCVDVVNIEYQLISTRIGQYFQFEIVVVRHNLILFERPLIVDHNERRQNNNKMRIVGNNRIVIILLLIQLRICEKSDANASRIFLFALAQSTNCSQSENKVISILSPG